MLPVFVFYAYLWQYRFLTKFTYYGLLCSNIYKFKGRHDWNVRHGFHTFSRKLLYWLMSIIVLPLGAPPPLGSENPSHLSLQFIIWFRESHQGPDCALCTKSERSLSSLNGKKDGLEGFLRLQSRMIYSVMLRELPPLASGYIFSIKNSGHLIETNLQRALCPLKKYTRKLLWNVL